MTKILRTCAMIAGIALAILLATATPAFAQHSPPRIGDPDFDYTSLSDEEFDALLDSIDQDTPTYSTTPLSSTGIGTYNGGYKDSGGTSLGAVKWMILLPVLLLKWAIRSTRR